MVPNSSSPVASWVLFVLASLAVVHALGESFGPPGMVAGLVGLAGAAIWLHRQADPLKPAPGRSFVECLAREARKNGRRKPPPDDAGGSAPVPSPLRPRPVLTGGAAKAIPSEFR